MEYILIRHFGALYINGDPATEYPVLNGEWFAPSEHLRLGNTHGNGLPWIDIGHAYISVNPLITGISLECLWRKKLHLAKKVLIDGLAYQMRLIRAGAVSDSDLGEIGMFVDAYGNGSAKDYPKVWYDVPNSVSVDEGNYFQFSGRSPAKMSFWTGLWPASSVAWPGNQSWSRSNRRWTTSYRERSYPSGQLPVILSPATCWS